MENQISVWKNCEKDDSDSEPQNAQVAGSTGDGPVKIKNINDSDSENSETVEFAAVHVPQEEAKSAIKVENSEVKKKGTHKVFAFEVLFLMSALDRDLTKKLQETFTMATDHKRTLNDQNSPSARYRGRQKSTPSCSLKDCMAQFRVAEKLSKEDSWYCNKCKEHVEATKQIEIFNIPNILIISINRFKRDSTYFNEKVSDHVSCPVEGFDISEFVLNKKGADIYDLTGVVNHFGGLQGGHYTSYARSKVGSAWHEYNDGMVTKVHDDSEVVSDAAYIFFFKRRGFCESEEFDFSLIRNELSTENQIKPESEEKEEDEAMPWEEVEKEEEKPDLHEIEGNGEEGIEPESGTTGEVI